MEDIDEQPPAAAPPRANPKRIALLVLGALVLVLGGGELIAHGLAKTMLEPACARYGAANGLAPVGYELSDRRASKNRRGARHYCTYVHAAGGETRVRISKLGWQWSLLSIPLSPRFNQMILAAMAVVYWYLRIRPRAARQAGS
jgi:hypothetical protein